MKQAVGQIIFFSNRDGASIGPNKELVDELAKHLQQFVRAPQYDRDGKQAYVVTDLLEEER